MASLLGIGPLTRSLFVLAAGLLFVAVAGLVAGSAAFAHPPKKDQPARPQQNTFSRPPAKSPPGSFRLRTSPGPTAGALPAPRLGQIPSVAGGIPRLDASGFAPNAPVFSGLQPELPVAAPLPHRGRERDRGRGQGMGHGDKGSHESCVEKDSGVTVWRGSCGG